MKFNAGNKKTRSNLWTRVKVKGQYDIHYTIDREQKREWCKSQESNSYFYYHYASRYWWFENEQDALLFTLKWGSS